MLKCTSFLFQNMLCQVLFLFSLFIVMFGALPLWLLYLAINSMSFLFIISLDLPSYFFLNINLKCLQFLCTLKLLLKISLGLKSKLLELMVGVSTLVTILSPFVWTMVFNISCLVLTHLSRIVLLRGNTNK